MNESEIHEIPLWCSRRHMCRDCMQLQYLGLYVSSFNYTKKLSHHSVSLSLIINNSWPVRGWKKGVDMQYHLETQKSRIRWKSVLQDNDWTSTGKGRRQSIRLLMREKRCKLYLLVLLCGVFLASAAQAVNSQMRNKIKAQSCSVFYTRNIWFLKRFCFVKSPVSAKR